MANDSPAHPAERLVAGFLGACGRSRGEAARFLWENGAEKLRRTAGDVGHLERLLGNELFSPLVRTEEFGLEALEQIEDSARQSIVAFPAGSEPARFLFSLKRSSSGEQAGRWSITGLERDSP